MDSLLSDFDSFSESSCSSDDDKEDMESLFGGQARTIFSSLEETIEKIDDFLMFERGFLHGDIVRLVSDPLSQVGKVVNVNMTVDLENVHGLKIHNVNSKYLHKIRSVSVGDHVVLGPWIGKVEKIVDRLTIVFDDGTKCQLSADGPEKIIAISPDFIDDVQLPFYPGQRVRIESSVSRSARWCGISHDEHEHGTVCNVDAGLVYVDWITCAGFKGKTGRSVPQCLQDSENLSVLSCFPQANWQLGDWCVIPNEVSLVKGHRQSEMLINGGACDRTSLQIAVIVKMKTKVDVQWQDGSQSLALDSHLLFPVNIVDAHDFWPGAFVLEKGTIDDSKKWGVVKTVDPKEKTAKVKWFKSYLDNSEEEQTEEEIVSAYELVEHSDYSFGLGDAILRTDESVMDLKHVENMDNKYLSCFGIVVRVKNGYVEVKWGTGATSKVAPYEIFRVDKCEGITASRLDNENVNPLNEELPVKDELFGQNLKDVLGLNYDDAKDSSSHSISRVAKGLFNSITSNLFGYLGTSLVSGYKRTSEDGKNSEKNPVDEEALELCNLNTGGRFLVAEDLEMHENIMALQIGEANEDITLPSSSKNRESFRPFDMVNDPSDHHFFNEKGVDLQSPQMKRGWLKKVHQEWSILGKDLPETIYVRAYEERMDLLRAAVVGTAGTPYHDGLFFFDIYFPQQYPNEPPMVYYNSGGLRINPNLYESGKVCLSLLNTWTGSQSEVWNPRSSTILQVLISLQALVLNETPYFNEAGYDTQIGKAEGEKNSVSYNENAFLVSCRSMLYLLRKPPMHFEALVDEHFSRRSKNILSACKAYMQGAPIGYPFDTGKDEQETQNRSSTGFKIMLAKLYSKLVEVFSEKGFDCTDSSSQVP